MNKLMVASLSLLLAGAAALPAQAQEERSWDREPAAEPGQVETNEARRAPRGEVRQERGEDRQERGEGRREIVREERTAPQDRQPAGRPWEPGQSGQSGVVQVPQSERQDRSYDRRDDRRDDRNDDRRYGRNDSRNEARYDNRYDNRYENRQGNRYDIRQDSRYDSRYDGRYDNRQDSRYDNRYDNRYVNGRYDVSRYSRHDDRRWNGNQWYPQYRYRAPVRYVYPRGYRSYQWRVGNRLPVSYYGSNYYVDYNAYRLPPPPYGYHWVRVDRDVVLVSIASGLIRDILYGLYY
jgi:Ni/Co efflux regulator RcnB